jgi:hypothetical protein
MICGADSTSNKCGNNKKNDDQVSPARVEDHCSNPCLACETTFHLIVERRAAASADSTALIRWELNLKAEAPLAELALNGTADRSVDGFLSQGPAASGAGGPLGPSKPNSRSHAAAPFKGDSFGSMTEEMQQRF